MELRYDVTAKDLAAANELTERLWRSGVLRGRLVFWLCVIPLASMLFAILVSIDLARDGHLKRGHIVVLVAVLLAFGSFLALRMTLFRKVIEAGQNDDPLPHPHRLVIDDDGVSVSNERGSTSFKWRLFVDVQEPAELVALVTEQRVCMFVPNRAFATDDMRREFLSRVRARIAANVAGGAEPR